MASNQEDQVQATETEYNVILTQATRGADLAMAVVEREGPDAILAAIDEAERASAEPIGWRASWFNWMVHVRGGVRVVVTLADGREVSLDRAHARMLGTLLLRRADALPRGDVSEEAHHEMVLGLCE